MLDPCFEKDIADLALTLDDNASPILFSPSCSLISQLGVSSLCQRCPEKKEREKDIARRGVRGHLCVVGSEYQLLQSCSGGFVRTGFF